MTEAQKRIAEVLATLCGGGSFSTKEIASHTPMFGHNRRIHSACTRSWLNQMVEAGWVEQTDALKPAIFRLTDAGRAHLREVSP